MRKFAEVIGQKEIISRLLFYLESYQTNGVFPHSIFLGQSGNGKTHIIRALASEISNIDEAKGGLRRKLVTISSNITSTSALFDQIFCPILMDGRPTIFFMDECHGLKEQIVKDLLVITQPNSGDLTTYHYGGADWEFDFRKYTFMFATTESHRVFPPLMDRVKRFDVREYTKPELAKIINLNLKNRGINADKPFLQGICEYVRRNGRGAAEIAKEIWHFSSIIKRTNLLESDLQPFVERLKLKPLGLNAGEVDALRILRDNGPLSLTNLSTKLGRPNAAVQREIERYPMALGFLRIDGKREITDKGLEYVNQVEPKKS